MKELDLYLPLKVYFENLGYEVKSEIKNLDVLCIKKNILDEKKIEDIIAIEIKINFNLKLLFQAINRQKFIDNVYIAILANDANLSKKNEILNLAKRLYLGVIFVHIRESGQYIEILENPNFFIYKTDVVLQKEFLKEFYGRNFDLNNAGISKTKVCTNYKENSINIAMFLKVYENLNRNAKFSGISLKQIREIVNIEHIEKYLRNNYYNLFFKVKRGYYQFNDKNMLVNTEFYDKLSNYYEEKYKKKLEKMQF